MEALLTQQYEAMRAVERSLDNFKKIGKDNYTYGIVRNRLTNLRGNFARCQQLHAQLLTMATAEMKKSAAYFKDSRFLTCEDHYNAASDYMTEFLVQLEPPPSPSAANVSLPQPAPNHRPAFQLPRINLPTFSGEFHEWESFRDRFKAIVLENPELSNVERLHYLSSCLKNEAADVLHNLAITDANFQIAWQLMLNRFENKRRIITVHLHALTNLPSVTTEAASAIRELREQANMHIQALKNIGRPVEHWDDILVYLVIQQLDKSSRKAWELHLGNNAEYPTWKELDLFLQSRICALETIDATPWPHNLKAKPQFARSGHSRNLSSHAAIATTIKCPMCNDNHFLSQCPSFIEQPPADRGDFVKRCQRCLNCFSSKHKVKECPNKYSCKKCKQRHHTLLHVEPSPVSDSPTATNKEHVSSHCLNRASSTKRSVLLATTWVDVSSDAGRHYTARALLDQGSVATLITESLAQRLRSPRTRFPVSISGVGEAYASAKQITKIHVAPCKDRTPVYSTTAIILKTLTNYIPSRVDNTGAWLHLRDLELADHDPMSSHPVDLIIGADLYGYLLRDGLRRGDCTEPVAQNTVFGWILSGPVASNPSIPPLSVPTLHCIPEDTLDCELRRFWEVEELPRRTHLTPLEQRCEHFIATHSRDASGRYIVRLPFVNGPPIDIGQSRSVAEDSLSRLERRLINNPPLAREYVTFMSEYEALGHMQEIDHNSEKHAQTVYIPHHAVLRESSSTSRLRVVFDASRPTSNGTSLNSHLMTGPKLQMDLPSIILRWRQHRYVYTADIEKMYRQIAVHERDVDFQRILWSPVPGQSIREYRLMTVTYGTACAPFLALRVLQQLAIDEGSNFPLALPIIRNQMYVDDCVFGADDEALARQIRDQLINLLKSAGFKLRKWASNCPSLLRDISPDDHGIAVDKSLHDDPGIKILGITWNPRRDLFQFKISPVMLDCSTKRQVLSIVARIFDPLGWVSPAVITAKIFLQRLWLLKLDWDTVLPDDFLSHWRNYYAQFPLLENLEIRRWTDFTNASEQCEMHGFADASSVSDSGTITTSLLAAKSKVAPVKPLSIPRLELSAALLLARTMEFIRGSLGITQSACYCWADSTITLAWLNQLPARWKTFVGNRVAEIHTLLPTAKWRHVISNQNPADCASRGLSISDLLTFNLRWMGPPWLRLAENGWPNHAPELPPDTPLEEKITSHALTSEPKVYWDLAARFSSWPKLLRVTAYVTRFVNRLKARSRKASYREVVNERNRRLGLTAPEIRKAKLFWLRQIQDELFTNEKRELSKSTPLAKGSPILSLNPVLDADGLLRVGGRLKNASLPEDAKHPILLASHPLTSLIVTHAHLRALHSGPQLTLRLLREEYWILRARQVVRACLHRCVICTRERAAIPSELMGNLPGVHVTRTARAFLHCGVDYAGPFLVRTTPGRGQKSHKAYLALFICLSTRAVHLELVSEYTTAAFLAAFDRFCARRGLPTDVYTDNGTTFHGADRELAGHVKRVTEDANLQNKLATEHITWHFLPPSAPHFGGLWEAGVRSVKHHLKRVIGAHTLTFEEIVTVLCQVEACLNSRPIASMSDDIESYSALTPGHFLIGTAITATPMPTLLDVKESRLSRWQLLRQMHESFWKAWAQEYLHTLQQRPKWRVVQKLARVGRVVLLRNPLLPPCKWELGRIISCHPGDDGLTRVVTVKTAKSTFKRPLSKLCFLPVEQETVSDEADHGGR